MIINGIEQGVSLYGFNQRYVEIPDYTIEDTFRELNELGVEKFEVVGSIFFDQYPRPAVGEVDRILDAAAQYGVKPFSYGGYIDHGRITGHTPNDEDYVLDLTADLKTARELGCTYARETNIPIHLMPLAAQLAEHYGVGIGIEVHAPSRPSDPHIQEQLEAFEKIGSDLLGFIPDFGCFIERPSAPGMEKYLAEGASEELLEFIIAHRHSGLSEAQMHERVREMGGGLPEKQAIADFFGFLSFGPADLEGFTTLLGRSLYFHSKFFHVTEDLTDPTIPVEGLLTRIVDSGFQGVLMSEYEGHAFHNDDAHEQLDRHLQLEQRVLRSVPVPVHA
ncbi:sugar phosphate isomerase/epimerase family protein [Luteimicrobium sp. DT211]|uniref:sugar phosphate isomerase/epimerase family protein n=1 Tax=Luteimicrobium sp. DT211 TaxID=3393412 RepID=UPI003CE6C705